MGSNNFILASLIGLTLSFVISSSLALDCYSCTYYEGVSSDDKCLKDYEDFEVSCEDEVIPPTNPPPGQVTTQPPGQSTHMSTTENVQTTHEQTGSTNDMMSSTVQSASSDAASTTNDESTTSTASTTKDESTTNAASTSENPETSSEKPETTPEKPETTPEKPETTSEKPETTSEKPETTSEKPETTSEKPESTSDGTSTSEDNMTTQPIVELEENETLKAKKAQNRFIRSVKPRDGPYYYCAKFETEVASKKVLIRSCVKQDDAASENELKKDCNSGVEFNYNHPNGTETDVLTGKLCLCDDDNCNSSTKMTITFGTFGALLGISLFKLFN